MAITLDPPNAHLFAGFTKVSIFQTTKFLEVPEHFVVADADINGTLSRIEHSKAVDGGVFEYQCDPDSVLDVNQLRADLDNARSQLASANVKPRGHFEFGLVLVSSEDSKYWVRVVDRYEGPFDLSY